MRINFNPNTLIRIEKEQFLYVDAFSPVLKFDGVDWAIMPPIDAILMFIIDYG